jgi:DedD protein
MHAALEFFDRIRDSTATRRVIVLHARHRREGDMAEPAITQDEQSLKQRAMRRLAIALALIAAAIVALALLDRYNASLKKSEPVLVPPRAAPAPPAPAPPPTAAPEPSPPSAAEESKRPPPPPPVVSNQELPAPPAPAPAPARPAAPESIAKNAPATHGAEKPAAPAVAEQKPVAPTAQKPAAPAAPTRSAQPPTAAPPTGRGFIVQVGVFMSGNNARALQNKLAEKGIPTYTETRVLVGPFNDRAEAEAVVRQIKDLGLEGVVVPPPAQ